MDNRVRIPVIRITFIMNPVCIHPLGYLLVYIAVYRVDILMTFFFSHRKSIWYRCVQTDGGLAPNDTPDSLVRNFTTTPPSRNYLKHALRSGVHVKNGVCRSMLPRRLSDGGRGVPGRKKCANNRSYCLTWSRNAIARNAFVEVLKNRTEVLLEHFVHAWPCENFVKTSPTHVLVD